MIKRIAVMSGDGIGAEVTREGLRVLEAMAGKFGMATEISHFPIGGVALDQTGDGRALEEVEADMIRLAIGRYRGHMTEIAKQLGIGRSTLYRKMRDFGLEAHPS